MEILNLQTNFGVLICGTESTALPFNEIHFEKWLFLNLPQFLIFLGKLMLLDDISRLPHSPQKDLVYDSESLSLNL